MNKDYKRIADVLIEFIKGTTKLRLSLGGKHDTFGIKEYSIAASAYYTGLATAFHSMNETFDGKDVQEIEKYTHETDFYKSLQVGGGLHGFVAELLEEDDESLQKKLWGK